MKKKFISLFVCSLLTTIISCDSSSKSDEIISKDFINASRKQQQVTGYLLNTSNLKELLDFQDVDLVRFAVSFDNNEIKFNAIGVDYFGKELITVEGFPYIDSTFDDNLKILDTSKSNISSSNSIVDRHILNSKTAYNYINNWQNELSLGTNLQSLTTYNNVPFKYFSLRKEVVQDLLNIQNISNVGLFIGVNPDNKMTTVLAAMDRDKKFIIPTVSGNFSTLTGAIYDFTTACQPDCNLNSDSLN